MTGSGSTVFGLFEREGIAREAARLTQAQFAGPFSVIFEALQRRLMHHLDGHSRAFLPSLLCGKQVRACRQM